MKKVKKKLIKSYTLKRLYRDDIDEIISIFKESFDKFDICIDDYKLDDIKELDDIKSARLKSFKIEYQQTDLGKPWVLLNITLDKDSAMLCLSDDSDMHIGGVAFKLDRLITSKKSFIGSIFDYWKPAATIAILIQCINAVLKLVFDKLARFYVVFNYVEGIVTLMALIWVFSAWFFFTQRHSIIYTIRSSTKSNFFSRKGDDIILILFTAIVSFLLGIVASTLLNNPK